MIVILLYFISKAYGYILGFSIKNKCYKSLIRDLTILIALHILYIYTIFYHHLFYYYIIFFYLCFPFLPLMYYIHDAYFNIFLYPFYYPYHDFHCGYDLLLMPMDANNNMIWQFLYIYMCVCVISNLLG